MKINEPELPEFTAVEKLIADNAALAGMISKIKYYFPTASEFFNDAELETLKIYAK